MRKILLQLAIMAAFAGSNSIFADYKISQRTTTEGVSTEVTVYAKGVRQRREQKTVLEDVDEDTAAMMANMMPSHTTVTQCDLKRDVTISEKKMVYFIDYYDWSQIPAETSNREKAQKVVVRGTATVSSIVTDSGKTQTMFGLPARWLKSVMTFETSPDSCDGKSLFRTEEEGWFVNLTLSSETCHIPRPPASKGGCRPKLIVNKMQHPGFMLEGTTKMFDNNKLQSTSSLLTTALTTSPLEQALFEIPPDYTEVFSISDLMGGGMPQMGSPVATPRPNSNRDMRRPGERKTVGIDFFTGNYSKVDQDSIRETITEEMNAKGFAARLINSPNEISSGGFDYVIGVEITSAKQSKKGKLGGLFGKVTGDPNAAKAGDSEVELNVSVFKGDGKTLVAQQSAKQKQSGTIDDAAKTAVEAALSQLIEKLR